MWGHYGFSPEAVAKGDFSQMQAVQSRDELGALIQQRRFEFDARNLEIAAITRAFKQLAKELDIPIILLSQLSRQPERRGGDHRPQLSDLRESGSIEQDADLIVFLYREAVYNKELPEIDRNVAEVIISKQRNGPLGTVRTLFQGQHTRFVNLAPQDDFR